MKCQDCDCFLTDEESVRKDERTGEYLDLCSECLSNLYKDLNDDLPFDILDDLPPQLDNIDEDEYGSES